MTRPPDHVATSNINNINGPIDSKSFEPDHLKQINWFDGFKKSDERVWERLTLCIAKLDLEKS